MNAKDGGQEPEKSDDEDDQVEPDAASSAPGFFRTKSVKDKPG